MVSYLSVLNIFPLKFINRNALNKRLLLNAPFFVSFFNKCPPLLDAPSNKRYASRGIY